MIYGLTGGLLLGHGLTVTELLQSQTPYYTPTRSTVCRRRRSPTRGGLARRHARSAAHRRALLRRRRNRRPCFCDDAAATPGQRGALASGGGAAGVPARRCGRRKARAMLKLSSMTGFGRAEGAAGAWSWAVEARSVNGRGLEVRFRGPPGFDGLERVAREATQARFQRGQLNVALQARRAETSGAVRIQRGGHTRPLSRTRRRHGGVRPRGDAERRRPPRVARRDRGWRGRRCLRGPRRGRGGDGAQHRRRARWAENLAAGRGRGAGSRAGRPRRSHRRRNSPPRPRPRRPRRAQRSAIASRAALASSSARLRRPSVSCRRPP